MYAGSDMYMAFGVKSVRTENGDEGRTKVSIECGKLYSRVIINRGEGLQRQASNLGRDILLAKYRECEALCQVKHRLRRCGENPEKHGLGDRDIRISTARRRA
jgi:hypothetical protein